MEKKPLARRASEAFVNWCAEDTPAAKFERTVAQGIVGVAVGALTTIANAPEWASLAVIPMTMAVLAPIQAQIGKGAE